MTREEARKAAEVMMAYANGKEIEYKCHIFSNAPWLKTIDGEPVFDWNSTEYRIKKEPTYRPFKDKEECWAEMQKHQPFGWLSKTTSNARYLISYTDEENIYMGVRLSGYSFEEAFMKFVFADGTPFGIKEE